jgi:hypothetical protein
VVNFSPGGKKMKKIFLAIFSVCIITFGVAGVAAASYILFDQDTDTIAVAGQTIIGTSFTFETRVLFTDEYNGQGSIFNEFTSGYEDKALQAGPSGFGGYAHPIAPSLEAIESTSPLTLGVFHHIAYVYDGSTEMLFLDGQLKKSRNASGDDVGDGSGSAHIGAIFRGSLRSGFIGFMDTLRISNSARYTAAGFTPVSGDLSSDADTLLLYNFNETPGSTIVIDLSGNSHDGTLGVGFSGATSPTFTSSVPIPGAIWLLGSGLLGLVGIRRKRS